VKPETTLHVPAAGESDISPEGALDREIAELGEWLAAQGLDLRGDHAPTRGGTRDRLYWRYGYFIGLQRALAKLTNRGTTLH
jgi:hypothetical protein